MEIFDLWPPMAIFLFLGALALLLWFSLRPGESDFTFCPACTGEGELFHQEQSEDGFTKLRYRCSCQNVWTVEQQLEKTRIDPEAN